MSDSTPLDPSFYAIPEDEAKFLKKCTGITDDEELKQHILTVQAEAYAVFPYGCLKRFAFVKLSQTFIHMPVTNLHLSSKLPGNTAYPAVINLGKTRENAIMLDIGCGIGNDSRRAIADGFPLHNVICSDLYEGFFNVGHKLYKTTPENFPLAFFEGDIFNTEFTFPETATIPKLSTLTNLGQLKGQISVIHASAFFHLFEHEKQRELAKLLAQLLSPQPGSIILGSQGGAKTRDGNTMAATMFNPETWKDVWIGENAPFKPEEVDVHAYARRPTDDEKRATTGQMDDEYFWLTWSVTRK